LSWRSLLGYFAGGSLGSRKYKLRFCSVLVIFIGAPAFVGCPATFLFLSLFVFCQHVDFDGLRFMPPDHQVSLEVWLLTAYYFNLSGRTSCHFAVDSIELSQERILRKLKAREGNAEPQPHKKIYVPLAAEKSSHQRLDFDCICVFELSQHLKRTYLLPLIAIGDDIGVFMRTARNKERLRCGMSERLGLISVGRSLLLYRALI